VKLKSWNWIADSSGRVVVAAEFHAAVLGALRRATSTPFT
jgi:hypothetical protein